MIVFFELLLCEFFLLMFVICLGLGLGFDLIEVLVILILYIDVLFVDFEFLLL